jgi:beta-ribofuranosylaminobenzene 5'-phosphate synthase
MTTVRVEAPARLHMGMLDAAGGPVRRFGGLGVALSRPAAVVEASPSDDVSAEGPDAERALAVARRCREALGLAGGAQVRVLEAIPPHVGLGSGTKLALAVTAAMAALAGQTPEPAAIARAAGRGARSAVGLWTFVLGGLVVEGGVRPGVEQPAPLLARHAMPDEWRCVLVIPEAEPGLSGRAEEEAFGRLRPDSDRAALIARPAARGRVVRLGSGRCLSPARRRPGRRAAPPRGGRCGAELVGTRGLRDRRRRAGRA